MAKNKLTSNRGKSKNLSAEEQEQALSKIKGGNAKQKSKYYGRVTVDFPHEVYDEMKELVEEEGRTLKGFVVSLVKKALKGR